MGPSTAEVMDAVRADLAERRAATLERRWLESRSQIAWRDKEIERLRGLVSEQLSELAGLRDRIRDLESRGRALAVEQLIAAFATAADRASIALESHQLTRLGAELKTVLQVADGNPGLIAATPELWGSEAVSTVAFELVPRPTVAGDGSAAEITLVMALRRLQEALDRPLPASAREVAGAVLAEVTGLLGAAPAPPTRAELESLVAALRRLGRALPRVRGAVDHVVSAHQELDDAPRRAQIQNFAGALLEVAAQLEAPAPAGRGWIHTVHREGAWYNEIEGERRLPGAHRTKRAAVAAGRKLAMARRTEHVIHKLDGTIGERNSYGHDPYPPRG